MSHSKRLLKHIALAVVFFFSFQIIAIPQAYAHCPSHSGQDGGESKTPSTPEGPSDESGEPGENPTEGGDDIVYLGKGEFVHSHQDLHIPAREISIDITRTYRSQKAFISRFGYGWSINHNIKLKKLENGNVIFFDETGKKIEYIPLTDIPISWGGIVTHISSDGSSYINIISHEDGTVTLKKKDGTRYHFNALGALSSIEGKNGNKITFTYDSAGPLPIYAKSLYFVLQTEGIVAYDHKLLKIADDAGRQIDFSYDQKGMLTSITDCAGRLINYSYDENGNLLTATDPQENTTIYTYDAGNNLVSITDPKGHTYLTNTYDQNDRVISQTYYGGNFTFAYDMENHVTTETNPRGIVTRHEMNEYGNPIRITRDVGGLNLTTVKTYDDSMNLVSQTDPLGNTTNYTYDFLDNLTSVTNAEGDITRFTYLFGTDRVTSITDPLSRVTSFEYDLKGNLTKITDALGNETSFTYEANGDLSSTTNADGKTTHFSYDSYGHLTKITDAMENNTTFTYDILGNITSVTDQNGNPTQYAYDQLNQLIQITDALSNVTKFTYDENGNRISIIDAFNNSTTFTYNAYNQLTEIADALGNQTTFTYDENGNTLSVTDAGNNTTTNAYDALDRLNKVTDALGNATEYTYDGNGNLASIKDARSNTTTYAYNSLNRLTTTTYPNSSTETYSYDKVGNLISKTDQKGNTIAYAYDSLNRLTAKTYPDDSQVTYAYDVLSRLTSATNINSTVSYSYDALNRVSQATQDTKTIGYEYDPVGNRVKLIYPDGSYITYTYDALNRLDQIKDSAEQVIADYTYDSLSRRTQLDLENGTQALYVYDEISRLTNLTNRVSSTQAIISSFDYTYDKVGNRTSMTTAEDIHSYTYDKIYQLISADYPDGYFFPDMIYNFDAVGNRTSIVNSGTTNYTSNNMNQYTDVGGTGYTYDEKGNLTSDGANKYTYDYENQLIELVTPIDTTTFGYDALGRRTAKSTSCGVVRYIYDGDQVIIEADGALNTTIATFLYGTGIDEVLTMTKDNSTYYYHLNGLGNIKEITNSTGSTVEKYEYDVYGQPSILDGSGNPLTESAIGNSYMFTGRRFDNDSGLYYYRTRYYDSYVGRFLQKDLWTWHADDPRVIFSHSQRISFYFRYNQILIEYSGILHPEFHHRYLYVKNNPTMFSDPFGLFRFGKRPLQGLPWIPGPSSNPVDNYFNTEISHEHGFFEDGSGDNIGFGPKGRFSEDPTGKGYRYDNKHYDDDIMREALKNVYDGKYSILGPWNKNNCQDWADRLREEYERLKNKRQSKSNPCP